MTQKIIAALGFRYRPTAQADLEAHAGALAALASDVWDVPPALLEQAATRYARQAKFRILPTAYELITLARQIDEEARPKLSTREYLQNWIDAWRSDPNRRHDIEWYITDDYRLAWRWVR